MYAVMRFNKGVYAQNPEISVKPSRRVNFPEKNR